MSDPRRTDEPRPVDALASSGRDAQGGREEKREEKEEKIEQLLLAGLEHYFAGEYDQAINIWTRALFIDRSHARARAYIERARSAQAERQRESEELLQRGVAAFHDGAAEEARRLLRDAIDQGAPPEEALAVLERINRVEQVVVPSAPAQEAEVPVVRAARRPTSRVAWATLAALGGVIIAAVAFAAGAFRADLAPLLVRPASGNITTPRLAVDEGPALPRRGENALVRARALAQSGRLREALIALDAVRPTDPQKADADRLRADLQKQLIALVAAPASVPPSPSPAP